MTNVAAQILDQAKTVIRDKDAEIKLALACIVSRGHLLIEDMPGVGKTTLVMTLSKLLGVDSRRVQFTVDTLPADILGSNVFNQKSSEFEFHPGPVFTNMLLADELNRANPRTQSALLQAMEEGFVSVEGADHPLPTPFVVVATQNPLMQSGTFPLPESQLDRFAMSLELNYASRTTEVELLMAQTDARTLMRALKPCTDQIIIQELQAQTQKVEVSRAVADYVQNLLQTSRLAKWGQMPLSTRAGLSLVRVARAWAYFKNRNYVIPEDVQELIIPCLGHRLGGNHGIHQGRIWAEQLLRETAVL